MFSIRPVLFRHLNRNLAMQFTSTIFYGFLESKFPKMKQPRKMHSGCLSILRVNGSTVIDRRYGFTPRNCGRVAPGARSLGTDRTVKIDI
jgi:hypothetical protein